MMIIRRAVWSFPLVLLATVATVAVAASPPTPTAARILEATGVSGGLVVHVGCGDGSLTAALRVSDAFLVQGLERDPARVAAARRALGDRGAYGPVTVRHWRGEGRLPYIDGIVDLIVASDATEVPELEIRRVLAPGGVAYLGGDGGWRKLVKAWPEAIDEWTHYLHDPSNNAVAHDRVVAPPRRYQWLAGPRYSRQHDHMSSVSAVVSAGGRVFYVFDDATRASILTPPDWSLIARDAFNGKLLWKRKIDLWHQHLYRLKSGPQILARRLVAVGDRLYATLGIDSPLSVLDAATGKVLRTYPETKATEEILCTGAHLVLSVAAEGQPLRSDPRRELTTLAQIGSDNMHPLWTRAPRTVMVLDAGSGRVLWRGETDLISMSLAADAERVLYHDGEAIRCLDMRTGSERWRSPPLPVKPNMRSSGGATLVLYEDTVLYSGQVPAAKRSVPGETTQFALSLEDGRELWRSPHHPCGHMGTPDDILVAGGLVWNGAVAKGTNSGVMTGRDPRTGEVKREFRPDVETHWFHHRCYRAKATDRYLLFSRTGIEFIDHAAEHWICHHWVRGACHYGILPANGLIYAPQHPCACYIEAKLSGFSALAPLSVALSPRREIPESERLERFPGGSSTSEESSARPARAASARADEWPTFRHDAARSGAVSTTVPPSGLKLAWRRRLGERLSAPVVAGGRLLIADVDSHRVLSVDASTGEPLWSFTAGGRVDSPPTVWEGLALFGCADGHVYALDVATGRLQWRYRAAPEDRSLVAWEQVESVWPLHGSVLVEGGVLYCVAGRSMFLDGGLRLLRLEPRTGRRLSETILDDRQPASGENLQVEVQGLNMPVALPDILSSDGKNVYMRSLPFDLEGRRRFVRYVRVKEQQGDDVHLFCPTGFLDDSLWHRTYWGYGRAWASGAGGYYQAGRVIPAGRPLVFDDDRVYGYGRLWSYYRWSTPLEYELFAAKKQPEIVQAGTERKPIRRQGRRVGTRTLAVTRFVSEWSDDIPVQVTSMVLTEGALFAAGPPDVVDEARAARTWDDPDTQRQLAAQAAALRGDAGSLLVAVARRDGAKLAAYRLDGVPRFDGLIAARGRLYVATRGGEVLCLGGERGPPLREAKELELRARSEPPRIEGAAGPPR